MDKPFQAYTGDEPYVFVCYAHNDSEIIYPEIDWLRQQGINLWYDEGISAGKNWRAAIGDSLLGASHVLFYISTRSLKSEHCNREINLALDKNMEVVPIYLEEVELTSDLMVGLNRVHALHRDQDGNYQQHLLNALGQSTSNGESREIIKTEDTVTGFQHRLSIGKDTARKLVYATIALVLLVAGFQVTDRFFLQGDTNTIAVNGSALGNSSPASDLSRRTLIDIGATEPIIGPGLNAQIAVSEDGRRLVFLARRPQQLSPQLYLQELDQLEARLLPDTEFGNQPFFSPDGQWIGFADNTGLSKISVRG